MLSELWSELDEIIVSELLLSLKSFSPHSSLVWFSSDSRFSLINLSACLKIFLNCFGSELLICLIKFSLSSSVNKSQPDNFSRLSVIKAVLCSARFFLFQTSLSQLLAHFSEQKTFPGLFSKTTLC